MNLEDALDREQALTVACPYCPAQRGELCVRWDQLRSRWVELERFSAHPARLTAAGVVHAPMDSREYLRD